MGNWFTHGSQGVICPFSRLIFLFGFRPGLSRGDPAHGPIKLGSKQVSWFTVFTFLLSFSRFGARGLFGLRRLSVVLHSDPGFAGILSFSHLCRFSEPPYPGPCALQRHSLVLHHHVGHHIPPSPAPSQGLEQQPRARSFGIGRLRFCYPCPAGAPPGNESFTTPKTNG